MPPRKRARTSSTSGSPSSETDVTTVELSGGWALSPALVQLWRSGRFTDTVVTVEGRSFVANRNVLAAGSEYFERHYDNEHMRDADHPKLLEHVTAAAFEPLLAFLYEGRCTFEESLLAPVLRAANYLNVAPLERAAVGALTERLSPSNALAAWTWGEELELPELAKAAKEAALKGFDEVEKIEEATFTQMQELVADDRLTAKSEEAVFSAVVRFAEAKQPAEEELLELLRYVRFPLMSKDFLLTTVRQWPLLQMTEGQKLLVEMLAPLVSGPAQQQARRGFDARFLCVFGGCKNDVNFLSSTLSTVEIYDAEANTWMAGTPMDSKRERAAVAVLGDKIYVMGGTSVSPTIYVTAESAFRATSSVDVFDRQTLAWTASAPMAAARMSLAAAVVGGKLYAIGGYDSQQNEGYRWLSSVEAYDPQVGTWANVAPMPTARVYAGAAVLNGKIYVVGGNNGNNVVGGMGNTTSMDVYDPQTNTWATTTPMRQKRSGHGAAVLGGKIYVAGGNTLSSVEVFDPQTNSWADVAPMSTSRHNMTLTALRGKLYAAGGLTHCILSTVEAYDPQQDRWEEVSPMSQARKLGAATAW